MYQGKHHKRSYKRSGKSIALLVSLLLIIGVTIGGTIAYLIDRTDPVTNTFNPSEVTTWVDETLEGSTKKDVKIKNTGDTEAWIRAAVVVTWQDEDCNVYGQLPVAGTDYIIAYNITNDGWVKGDDGFYYWTKPVKSVEEAPEDCLTGVLIESCTYFKNAPEGYYLTVEIIGSGIQSKPSSVFNEEWTNSGLEVITDEDGNSKLEKNSGGGAN